MTADIINSFIGTFLCSEFVANNGVNKIPAIIVICHVEATSQPGPNAPAKLSGA